MNQRKTKLVRVWLVIIVGLFALAGCMAPTPKPGETFSCAKESDLSKTIAPEASLENFNCVIKTWEGQETLHFMVAVKNISDQEQRFKVNIFLENGKAVGGLLPAKTNKGLVKPGQIAEFTYPVPSQPGAPGKVDVIIKTMSK